jgi:hypothetical protein
MSPRSNPSTHTRLNRQTSNLDLENIDLRCDAPRPSLLDELGLSQLGAFVPENVASIPRSLKRSGFTPTRYEMVMGMGMDSIVFFLAAGGRPR